MTGCGLRVDSGEVDQIRGALQSIVSDDTTVPTMYKTARERVESLFFGSTEASGWFGFAGS
jgi:cobalamin biosynthesis protein CobD/CbiB